MRTRTAVLGLLLVLCMAAAASGLLYWLDLLNVTALSYVGLFVVFAGILLISQRRRE